MKAAIILAAALAATSASAEFMDGNKLLNYMNSENSTQKGISMGYIMGVTDMGINFTQCAPSTVTLGQLYDMVKNHLTAFPEVRHKPADLLVNKVLQGTWPCAKHNSNSL